jgi:hypothetical protein
MNAPRTQVILDGLWTLAYDAKHAGIDARWFEALPAADGREVQLPSMQSQGIAANGGVGWFFKSFEFDSAWQGQFAEITLEAANFPVEAWLNGTRLGSHPGGGTPARFPVTAHFRPGTNLLCVRLAMAAPGEEIVGVPVQHYPLDTLGSVALSFMPKAHIASIFLQPDIRRKRVMAQVEAPSDCTVRLEIAGTEHNAEGEAGELIVEFPEFNLWSPDTPECYTLRASLLQDGQVIDTLDTVFGMREFTVKDERFYLNNRPYFIKTVSCLPQYPQSLRADKLSALLRREIGLVKDGGFNTVRVESGPAPAVLLDLAAELGVLVFQEVCPPHRVARTSDWEGMAEALVARDRNQTALVAWCGLRAPGAGRLQENCGINEVRALDPSRLILCDAPGERTQALLRPYRDVAEPFESLETVMDAPVNAIAKDYLRLSGDPERLNYQGAISVAGVVQWNDGTAAGAARDTAFAEAFAQRQVERCFGTVEKYAEAAQNLQNDGLRAQLDAVRCNVKMMGYGVRLLCDGPDATPFGLADMKRHAKPALKALKPVQQEVRPVVLMYKTNLVPREEVSVTILLINEARLEGRGELSLQVVGPTNQVLWKKKRLVKIPRHGRELWTGDIAASGSTGPHRFVVRLIQDHRVIGENSVNLHVVQPIKADTVEVNFMAARGALRSACGRLAKLHNVLSAVHIVPRMGNTIRAYPASDLLQILAQVYEGAVAIVFGPPEDWNELAEMVDPNLRIQSRCISGRGTTARHYAKLHPVFDGLPSRDLMQQPYQNVLPLHAFESDTDEEMSGVHCAFPANGDAPGTHWWGSNLVVRRLGGGRVVFTHLRILEHLGNDPVADRLFVNLLNHFSRRSVPSTEMIGADQKAVEWMNQERSNSLRKWMVLGTFPNWNGLSGHNTAYPPEKEIEFEATYPGWYRAIHWKPWWTRDVHRHALDFHAALDADSGAGEACRYGTTYAYAEFSCDRRQEVALNFGWPGGLKVWLNGALAHESEGVANARGDGSQTALAWVKQGKNTLLVKCSKGPGPMNLSFDLESTGTAPIIMNWWK